MILYKQFEEFKVDDTRDLAKYLGVTHKEVMDAWRYIENRCVSNRSLIKSVLGYDPKKRESYLYNISDSLIGMIMVHLKIIV